VKNNKKITLSSIYLFFIPFLAWLFISCEDNNASEPTEGGLIDGVYTIYAGNMYYNPTSITISQGDSITFVNEEGFHDVYTTSGPVELSLNPCSGPCTIGTLIFEVAGEYDYICSIGSHAEQGMTGTVIVTP
tara:strand:+ start:399 stop:794 length:396 start_codon:yes stop_codon:yes gene_type:complete